MESQDLRKAGLKVTHPRRRILELLRPLRADPKEVRRRRAELQRQRR